MTREFYRENKGFFNAIDGLLLKNTVLEKGLVVAPVVVVSNSLKNAVALSLVFGLITFFTVLAVSFVPKRIPHTIRVIISVLLAAVLYIPIAMLVDLWFPGSSYQIGVFVPLMITNSLVVWRSESRFHKEGRSRMIGDLICHILGFFVVIAVVGAVRELWGAGTLWGNPMSFAQYPVTGILLPFAGFVLVGFLAALLHKYRNYLAGSEGEPEEFGYQSCGMTAQKKDEQSKSAVSVPVQGTEVKTDE